MKNQISKIRNLLTIGLALMVFSGGIVYAYFTSSATSSSNSFSAGTLTLKLSKDDSTYSDSVTATWGKSNMKPGDSASGTLYIKNTGSIAANHIEITTSNSITEASSGPGTTDTTKMDKVLKITTLTYDGTNLLATLTDANSNGIKDLDDLESTTLDNLSLTDINTSHTLAMTVQLDSSLAENQHQGDSVQTTMTITLKQEAGL